MMMNVAVVVIIEDGPVMVSDTDTITKAADAVVIGELQKISFTQFYITHKQISSNSRYYRRGNGCC